MCLARVRFSGESEDVEPVVTDVARVEASEQGLIVSVLLGKTYTIDAAIKSIDFMESTIVIEKRGN